MTDEELDKFSEKLKQGMSFPGVYMFKFIIQSEHRNIALVESLFGSEADIKTKESEKGKYTSVTASVVVINAEEVISIYRKALKIKGIMVL
jgi:putative lipoic acid-binding regulatory protein